MEVLHEKGEKAEMSESEKDRSLKSTELPKRAGLCNSARSRINVERKEDLSLKKHI